MSDHDELMTIADTIERNGGWHIAAVKVRAAAERIEHLEAALRGVLRIADRKTDEFDAARAARGLKEAQ